MKRITLLTGIVVAMFAGTGEASGMGFNGALPGATPEPISMVLIGVGLLGLGLAGRRRWRK